MARILGGGLFDLLAELLLYRPCSSSLLFLRGDRDRVRCRCLLLSSLSSSSGVCLRACRSARRASLRARFSSFSRLRSSLRRRFSSFSASTASSDLGATPIALAPVPGPLEAPGFWPEAKPLDTRHWVMQFYEDRVDGTHSAAASASASCSLIRLISSSRSASVCLISRLYQ